MSDRTIVFVHNVYKSSSCYIPYGFLYYIPKTSFDSYIYYYAKVHIINNCTIGNICIINLSKQYITIIENYMSIYKLK